MMIQTRESNPKRSTPSSRTNGGIATMPTSKGISWPIKFQILLRASRRPLVRFGIALSILIKDGQFLSQCAVFLWGNELFVNAVLLIILQRIPGINGIADLQQSY